MRTAQTCGVLAAADPRSEMRQVSPQPPNSPRRQACKSTRNTLRTTKTLGAASISPPALTSRASLCLCSEKKTWYSSKPKPEPKEYVVLRTPARGTLVCVGQLLVLPAAFGGGLSSGLLWGSAAEVCAWMYICRYVCICIAWFDS